MEHPSRARRRDPSFASTSSADAARYDVVITNALGAITSNTVILTVNSRDFSGTYFGTFGGTAGEFALFVRADRSAVSLVTFRGSKRGSARSTFASISLEILPPVP